MKWYAVYVKAKHERKVFEMLQRRDIEAYLPLRKVVRQWSDRKKTVEEPLIRGYLFVRIDIRRYYETISVPGIINFVRFDNRPAIIPEHQINDLKLFLKNDIPGLEVTNERIKKGQLVKIRTGAFANFIGEISELRGRKRLLIRIDQLGCIIHADLGSNQVELIEAVEIERFGK
ncbi:transcription antitermination factor NusG [Mangrovibacterium marinum]|uniref:Transcription antitermination factor NusG n=2 Tax=Mangrovibacterium marinum TaxID=1639118 RepID=A0A2T5C0W6_9BACT|nr:UpxY family transcription antiterminator [Mangrovibacterium marinum]PTN08273.1 transcription antitermination factor NusG [Mangrovibacterium marinum]